MTAVIKPSAYAKVILHAAKYPSCPIGGYVIGQGDEEKITISDVIPMCHSNPCGPMFEIAAEMMEKLLSNTTSKIIGYYYANESVTAPRLSYINQLVESIRTNTSSTSCLLLELQTDGLSQKDVIALKGTSMRNKAGATAVVLSTTNSTASAVNDIIDSLLQRDVHHKVSDFEDHMDTADASINGQIAFDFRNLFIDSEFD